MPLLAKSKVTPPIEPGIYPAVCYSVLDLGESDGRFGLQHQVMLTWELPTLTVEYQKDGVDMSGRRVINRYYNLTLSKGSILRQHLESWRGKKFTNEELEGFDMKNLLGKSCQLNIMIKDTEDGRQVNNINLVIPPTEKFEPENELEFFSFADALTVDDLPKHLPDWKIEKIQASISWKQIADPPKLPSMPTKEDFGDEKQSDLPF